jgi:hypothetical protein
MPTQVQEIIELDREPTSDDDIVLLHAVDLEPSPDIKLRIEYIKRFPLVNPPFEDDLKHDLRSRVCFSLLGAFHTLTLLQRVEKYLKATPAIADPAATRVKVFQRTFYDAKEENECSVSWVPLEGNKITSVILTDLYGEWGLHSVDVLLQARYIPLGKYIAVMIPGS